MSQTTDLVMTQDQQTAVDKTMDWLRHGDTQDFLIAGPAGTGKTTVLKEWWRRNAADIAAAVGDLAFTAYTGKAAFVLQQKGLPGQTLHSLLYIPEQMPNGRMVYHRRDSLEYGLVVVDECFMLHEELKADLLAQDVRILWVGDNAQLAPLGKDPWQGVVPDVQLEQIHRQAAQSEIIRFCQHLRMGGLPNQFHVVPSVGPPELVVGTPEDFEASFLYADMILCGYNKTRININKRIRRHRGYPDDQPVVGDKVICLRNNRNQGVFNGMVGTLTAIHNVTEHYLLADVTDAVGNVRYYLRMLRAQFNNPEDQHSFQEVPTTTYFDYGYALTTHKAQGSEDDKVLVLEQVMEEWIPARWRYTAASRAAKQLVYCTYR